MSVAMQETQWYAVRRSFAVFFSPRSTATPRILCVPCIIFLITLFSCNQKPAPVETSAVAPIILQPPAVDTVLVITQEKLEMTIQYCHENYGFSHYRLDTPRIVLVHYTAIGDLDATLNLFKKDLIASSREDISKFSKLNVGIHYVVAKDGRIFKLTPDSIVARHVIGLNHVSLGIENVAADSTELTDAQVESNARLIEYLVYKYPTIQFMSGHHEYNNSELPHYKYYLSMNPAYKPHGKIDPGNGFMSKLRTRLSNDGVVLAK